MSRLDGIDGVSRLRDSRTTTLVLDRFEAGISPFQSRTSRLSIVPVSRSITDFAPKVLRDQRTYIVPKRYPRYKREAIESFQMNRTIWTMAVVDPPSKYTNPKSDHPK